MPSKVPTYASACSGTVLYSSACSCIGITCLITTIAAPTYITTSTSTITVTSTAIQESPASNSSTSKLKAALSTPNTPNAAVFSLDSNGNLFNGYRANTDRFSPATIFFDTPGQFTGTTPLTCTIPAFASGALSCTGYTAAASIFQLCPGGVRLVLSLVGVWL
ncbi:hypothetical protein BDZ45DRAFT_742232 [Acephala macrosclerotiorum]|nr:hypothetical protein BDZ45DRAFT_742232 [Acephala macrosclerotiorum]